MQCGGARAGRAVRSFVAFAPVNDVTGDVRNGRVGLAFGPVGARRDGGGSVTDGGTSRRRFLTAAGAGAALLASGALANPALASGRRRSLRRRPTVAVFGGG